MSHIIYWKAKKHTIYKKKGLILKSSLFLHSGFQFLTWYAILIMTNYMYMYFFPVVSFSF